MVVDGHLPQLVRRRRAIFSIRRAELLDAVRVVDLRRLPAQPRQGQAGSVHFFFHYISGHFSYSLNLSGDKISRNTTYGA